MRYEMGIGLLLVFLVGCSSGGVVSLTDLKTCWQDKSQLEKDLGECNGEIAHKNCNVEKTLVAEKEDRIEWLETELKVCLDKEPIVCEVCSECEECLNTTIYLNTTTINQTFVYLGNCSNTNQTNSTGA